MGPAKAKNLLPGGAGLWTNMRLVRAGKMSLERKETAILHRLGSADSRALGGSPKELFPPLRGPGSKKTAATVGQGWRWYNMDKKGMLEIEDNGTDENENIIM